MYIKVGEEPFWKEINENNLPHLRNIKEFMLSGIQNLREGMTWHEDKVALWEKKEEKGDSNTITIGTVSYLVLTLSLGSQKNLSDKGFKYSTLYKYMDWLSSRRQCLVQ